MDFYPDDEADALQRLDDLAAIDRHTPTEPPEPPFKHCKRCDAPTYDLNAGACWFCGTEFDSVSR